MVLRCGNFQRSKLMKPEKKPNPGTDKNSSKGGTNPPDTRGKPIKKRKLRELLMEILCRLLRLEEKHDLRFAWKISRATAKERNMPLDLTCTNEEKIEIFANPVTSTGKPTAIDGAISVSVVSGDGTTAAGSGPNAAFLVSGDNPGDTTYLVEAEIG